MRRIFALILGLMLLVVPAAVGAQDSRLVWDLDGVFKVTDLGFQFNFPKDWIVDFSQGIRVAENKDDLAAIVDTDVATQAKGYTIALTGVTLDQLGLPADATLEDAVDTLIKAGGITETGDRIEVPVMTRRSITLIGTNSSGRPGLITIWTQDSHVVVFILGAPELTEDLGYTWGNVLGNIAPVGALELSDEPLDSPEGDFTIRYPQGWFPGDKNTGSVAESDSSSHTDGIKLLILEFQLSMFGEDVKDLDSFVDSMKAAQGWTDNDAVISSEHVILGQPAMTLTGPDAKNPDKRTQITFMVLGENGVMISTFYPSEERLTEFQPTHLAMLQSIEAADKAI